MSRIGISRAQYVAVLVGSSRLLDMRTPSVDQMRLVNALCRFVDWLPKSSRDVGPAG